MTFKDKYPQTDSAIRQYFSGQDNAGLRKVLRERIDRWVETRGTEFESSTDFGRGIALQAPARQALGTKVADALQADLS